MEFAGLGFVWLEIVGEGVSKENYLGGNCLGKVSWEMCLGKNCQECRFSPVDLLRWRSKANRTHQGVCVIILEYCKIGKLTAV